MKIATWNVNSIGARLPVVLKWIEAATPDVLCLQEIKCIDAKFPREDFTRLGYEVETFGQPAYNGVAIISRSQSTDVQRGFAGDDSTAQSRLLAATIEGVRIVNVYVPNGQAVGSQLHDPWTNTDGQHQPRNIQQHHVTIAFTLSRKVVAMFFTISNHYTALR